MLIYLWLGLVLFLGVHAILLFADVWRSGCVDRIGLVAWKGLHSAIALFVSSLIVWGYGVARQQPAQL